MYFLHTLTAASAVCLDGTPGAFYVQLSESGSTAWQLYFEGGGWCYDLDECSSRATGNMGSSAAYPSSTVNPDFLNVTGGIVSSDCAINPTFCDFNKVYLKYCDGNSFAGARDGAVDVVPSGDCGVSPLYFRGHEILKESLAALTPQMVAATEVHVTGCSAGGLAAYLHADLLGQWAEEHGRR